MIYLIMHLAVSPLEGWAVDSVWDDLGLAMERLGLIPKALLPRIVNQRVNEVPEVNGWREGVKA